MPSPPQSLNMQNKTAEEKTGPARKMEEFFEPYPTTRHICISFSIKQFTPFFRSPAFLAGPVLTSDIGSGLRETNNRLWAANNDELTFLID